MTEIRTTAGRVPGTRGQSTRTKLLDSLGELLSDLGYRDVTVRKVARKAGPSAAAFYEYFPTLDDGVRELAKAAATAAADAFAEIYNGPEERNSPTAEKAVDAFFTFWRQHKAVLRVVDLLAATDESFAELRAQTLNGLVTHLERTITASGRETGTDPRTAAVTLAITLASAAAQEGESAALGVKPEAVRAHLIRLVEAAITGRASTGTTQI